jgi:hypothetical protein
MEVITIRSVDDWANAVSHRKRQGGHLLPVIDLTGKHATDADCSGWNSEQRVIADFTKRLAEIANWAMHSSQPNIKLLAHIYVTGRPLTARYTPQSKEAISYGRLVPVPTPRETAELLASAGFLSREFFDRIHVCDRCGSSRLNVRQECTSCRGANIETTTILHHFRCVYHGPEPDFRAKDERLVCPKCSRELRHYSVDYERSGTAQRCACCGYTSTEPAIGFVCMDCTGHFDGESARAIDHYHYHYHYHVTDAGMALLQGHARISQAAAGMLLQACPLTVVQRINTLAAKGSLDFTLCEIVYKRERWVVHAHGVEAFERARQQLLDDLRSKLDPTSLVCAGRGCDYVLITENSKAETQQALTDHLLKCGRGLLLDLRATVLAFGHEEILPCLS